MPVGHPDWQQIAQWLGAPIVQATALAIGAGTHDDGPFALASWASVVVAIKPTGGNVSVTVKQKITGGPTTLELDTTFVVPAGQTVFESVVLFGDAVSLHLAGTAGGETVDYALFPSNTTTNAQVLASAVLNFQHNGVLVAAEPTLDLIDGDLPITLADDAANTRVLLTFPNRLEKYLLYVPPGTLTVGAGAWTAFDTVNLRHTLVVPAAYVNLVDVEVLVFASLMQLAGTGGRLSIMADGAEISGSNGLADWVALSNLPVSLYGRHKKPAAGSHTYDFAGIGNGGGGSVAVPNAWPVQMIARMVPAA